MGPSTLASWALLIQRTLAARGIDADVLFRRAKLDPVHLSDPNARYPMVAVKRLWTLAVEATHDSCLGLEVGQAWHPTTFHALGYSAIASASLREALGYVVRYSRVVTTGAQVELIDRGAEVALRLTPGLGETPLHPEATQLPLQAAFAALAVLCREVRRAPLDLVRVTFDQMDERCRAPLQSFFECPVVFGDPDNSMVFSAAVLDEPLPTANPLLARINEQALARYDAGLHAAHVAERVRARLERALPAGEFGQAAVARSLNLSLRSMQRKLAQEGTTYRELLDETRRQLADQYSRDSTLSASEVAYLLGFEEASSYSRAMRRWQAPSGDRKDSKSAN
jgi:AraC-like DNA-binding protein